MNDDNIIMKNQIVLITGANSGIGKVTARELARKGAVIVMVCRDKEKGETARDEIIEKSNNPNIDLILADMSIMESVRELAENYRQKYDQLDVLINNAGIYVPSREETKEGLEKTFATNYFGPFLLTHLLLDLLKKSAPTRVVNVSSDAHYRGKIELDDLNSEKNYSQFGTYSDSKLALNMFSYELSDRIEGSGVTVNCLHPGFVNTNFGKNSLLFRLFMIIGRFFAKNPEQGAKTSIYVSSSPEVKDTTGKYFDGYKTKKPKEETLDKEKRKKLWERTEKILGL